MTTDPTARPASTPAPVTCRACAGPVAAEDLNRDDNIALCMRHWNWWVARFVGADDLPPCAAHLIREETA